LPQQGGSFIVVVAFISLYKEERAREIEGVMDWMRDNDACSDVDDIIEKFSQSNWCFQEA
jgi:hypothetical protein